MSNKLSVISIVFGLGLNQDIDKDCPLISHHGHSTKRVLENNFRL